eukprot:Colp12_sorted_trinity150504_noHs@18209
MGCLGSPQLLHISALVLKLLHEGSGLGNRHIVLLLQDLHERSHHVGAHRGGTTHVHVGPLVEKEVKQLLGGLGLHHQVLHIDLLLGVATEGGVEASQHALLLEGLKLVAVDEIHAAVLAAEEQNVLGSHGGLLLLCLELALLQQGAHGSQPGTGTDHQDRRAELRGQAEARGAHEHARVVGVGGDVPRGQSSELLTGLERELGDADGHVHVVGVHRGGRGDGVVAGLDEGHDVEDVGQGDLAAAELVGQQVHQAFAALLGESLHSRAVVLVQQVRQPGQLLWVRDVGQEVLEQRLLHGALDVVVQREGVAHRARGREGVLELLLLVAVRSLLDGEGEVQVVALRLREGRHVDSGVLGDDGPHVLCVD